MNEVKKYYNMKKKEGAQVSIEKNKILLIKRFYELQQECLFSNPCKGEDQDHN
jgi:hypothetical protein